MATHIVCQASEGNRELVHMPPHVGVLQAFQSHLVPGQSDWRRSSHERVCNFELTSMVVELSAVAWVKVIVPTLLPLL